MANQTASGTNPALIWQDGSSNDLWRLIAHESSSPLELDEWTGSNWVTRLVFDSDTVTSKLDFAVDGGGAAYRLIDTSSFHDDFRLRTNGSKLFLEVDDSGWSSLLEISPPHVYAPKGMSAGHALADAPPNAIRWTRHTGTTSGSPSSITISLPYVEKALGGSFMFETDTTDEFNLSDCQAGSLAAGFSVEISRSAAGDEMIVTPEGSTFANGKTWHAVVFHQV